MLQLGNEFITVLLSSVFKFQIPITLHKETGLDAEGREVLKCGFKIGGGIDQDFRKSPQGYTDNVRTKNFFKKTIISPNFIIFHFL